ALDAVIALSRVASDDDASRAGARATIVGLFVCGAVALIVFVAPNWTEYRFYNWQMSVTRKPSYDLRSLVDRVTWFPILQGVFTCMWFVVFAGVAALLGLLGRWRRVSAPERLLAIWIVVGTCELLLHDVGNERRFLIFIPALIAVAALVLGRDRTLLPA